MCGFAVGFPLFILIVVSDFPKITETFALRNAQHYLQQGHSVELFHLKPYRKNEVVHPAFADVVARGLALPWLSLRTLLEFAKAPLRVMSYAVKIFKSFWRTPRHLLISLALLPKALNLAAHCRANGVDHIHAEFAGYPATVAWIAAGLTGIPFSFSAHAHDIFLVQGLLSDKARDAEFVRAISQFNKQYLEALPGMPASKVEVLHCGVPTGEITADAQDASGFRIVFVGSLEPRKGVDVLLRAVAQLPAELDWTLDILGGGDDEEQLRALAASLPTGRVKFHGPQNSDNVREAMKGGHVVVVPSRPGKAGRSEGIPVVLMEAMSLGRPVVTTRLSGIPELVVDGDTGLLVEPNDEDGLAQALHRLANDQGFARDLAQNGRARVEEDFNIDKTAPQLLSRMLEVSA